jgi:sugar/nucleoside kinase (ribokinase family)
MNQESFPVFQLPPALMNRELDAIVLGTGTMEEILQIPCWPSFGGQQNFGIERLTYSAGGCAVNVAAFIGRMGGKTSLITRLGSGQNGQGVLDELVSSGVGSEYINQISGIDGNIIIILTNPEGDWTVLTYFSPEMHLSGKDIPGEQAFQRAKFLHIDGFTCRSPEEIKAVDMAVELAHKQGLLVSVDCAVPTAQEQPEFLRGLFSRCDIFFANMQEATIITGMSGIEEIIHNLQEKGPGLSVLKVGREGAYFITRQAIGHVPAYEVQVVDTVAAGDAMIGTVILSLSQGCSLYEAANRGSAAGALACLNPGSLSGRFSLIDINALIARGPRR